MMFLLFGRITTCVGVHVLDRVEQFGGRRVERLASGDDALHAELSEQLDEPVAAAHRDDRRRDRRQTRRVTAAVDLDRGAGERGLPVGVLFGNLLEQVGDADLLRPTVTSSATSIAAPMSFVWTWQFQSPSPPTTTIESPISPSPA